MSLGPLPPVPNWLRVVISGIIDNKTNTFPWANVLHFQWSGTAPTDANLANAATFISGQWATHMAPECPAPTQLTKVVITDLTSTSAAEGEVLTDQLGTRGDDSIPANAAFLMSYPVANRYRGGHPRQYLYVLGNADLDGASNWSDAATIEVQTHWQDFISAIEGHNEGLFVIGTFGAIRYYGKFEPNDGPPRYRLVTPIPIPLSIGNSVGHKEIASQRRRVGRRKR